MIDGDSHMQTDLLQELEDQDMDLHVQMMQGENGFSGRFLFK